jgi:hypothetical protein
MISVNREMLVDIEDDIPKKATNIESMAGIPNTNSNVNVYARIVETSVRLAKLEKNTPTELKVNVVTIKSRDPIPTSTNVTPPNINDKLIKGVVENRSKRINRNVELSFPRISERADSKVVRNISKVCPSRSDEIEPAVSAGATKQAVRSWRNIVVPNKVFPIVCLRSSAIAASVVDEKPRYTRPTMLLVRNR